MRPVRRRMLFSLLSVAALVLMVEAASYGYYRYALADDFMPIDISDSFHDIPDLFEQRSTDAGEQLLFSRYFPTRYYVSDRSYRGKTMAATKTPQTFRVFTFGGSSTAGSPWGHEASFIRTARDHGAQVVLVSQPSNMFYEPSWFPGERSQAEQLAIDEMRTAYARRDYAVVRVRAADALRLNRENPLAHFFGGLAAAHQGDSGAAREHLLMAIDLDESPERFTRAYRDIERALDQEWPEAFFVDAWQAAIDFVDDGLVDGRLVIDKMHPTVEGHKLIARAIVENFFVRQHVRDDLFDYRRDDLGRIWKNNIDPGFYHVICARYFDVAEPSGCVDEVAGRHAAAPQGSPQWRIYRSSWEYLFYYGLRSGDATWLQRAARIYRGPSLEHAMAPQPSLQAAQ